MARPEEPLTGRHEAALERDAALGRISRTRRWMIAAAAALTAGLAALASVLLPGKSLGAKSPSTPTAPAQTAAASSSSTPALPAPADPGQLGLQGSGQAPQALTPAQQAQQAQQQAQPAPAAAPAPSSGGGAVVSGGS
jgi:hypothetical protein